MRQGLQTQQDQTHRHDSACAEATQTKLKSRRTRPFGEQAGVVIPGVGHSGVGHVLLYNIGASYKGVFSL